MALPDLLHLQHDRAAQSRHLLESRLARLRKREHSLAPSPEHERGKARPFAVIAREVVTADRLTGATAERRSREMDTRGAILAAFAAPFFRSSRARLERVAAHQDYARADAVAAGWALLHREQFPAIYGIGRVDTSCDPVLDDGLPSVTLGARFTKDGREVRPGRFQLIPVEDVARSDENLPGLVTSRLEHMADMILRAAGETVRRADVMDSTTRRLTVRPDPASHADVHALLAPAVGPFHQSGHAATSGTEAGSLPEPRYMLPAPVTQQRTIRRADETVVIQSGPRKGQTMTRRATPSTVHGPTGFVVWHCSTMLRGTRTGWLGHTRVSLDTAHQSATEAAEREAARVLREVEGAKALGRMPGNVWAVSERTARGRWASATEAQQETARAVLAVIASGDLSAIDDRVILLSSGRVQRANGLTYTATDYARRHALTRD